jgi:hypothetical protein
MLYAEEAYIFFDGIEIIQGVAPLTRIGGTLQCSWLLHAGNFSGKFGTNLAYNVPAVCDGLTARTGGFAQQRPGLAKCGGVERGRRSRLAKRNPPPTAAKRKQTLSCEILLKNIF